MTTPSPVRFGIVGIGKMGSQYADWLRDGKVANACLGAVCDADESRFEDYPDAAKFTDAQTMFRSGEVDAVAIVTPHFQHTPLAIEAFAAGLNVLIEKPLAVTTADCQKIIEAYHHRPNPKQVFAAMLNQRTHPTYLKLKQMIDTGELGEIQRISWIITDWFRTDAYYKSGGWRATWAGEGGGVLVNQCPHQLDLMQWLFDLPSRVRAFAQYGADHDIEVEDRVTAYMDYANGATGTFIAATGEFPGTNRLEVACDRGRVVIEHSVKAGNRFEFVQTETSLRDHTHTTDEVFAGPKTTTHSFEIGEDQGEQHLGIFKNLTEAIQHGNPLIAPGVEGIRSVELCNAMLHSAFTDTTVALPISPQAFAEELDKRIATSRYVAPETKEAAS